jgi:hypothetical protein
MSKQSTDAMASGALSGSEIVIFGHRDFALVNELKSET